MSSGPRLALVHLAAGIGDIVLGTPLVVALDEMGFDVELALHADYAETAGLFDGWSAIRLVHSLAPGDRIPPPTGYDIVVPAVPPFYWSRFAREYSGVRNAIRRPPDALFHDDQQGWYLAFAQALGYPAARRPPLLLPITAGVAGETTRTRIVLAPGCKTGSMAVKRWPHFPALAERLAGLAEVTVIGTGDDMHGAHGTAIVMPPGVRSCVDQLTLRETAELLATADVVVANDSGLAQVTAALGTPAVLLFGPTPDATLGGYPENVTVLRAGLPCEPCWRDGRLRACHGRVTCLAQLSVDAVEGAVRRLLGRGVVAAPAAPPPLHATTSVRVLVQPAAAVPLVSCIMPTRDRPALVPQAVQYFLRQDWPNRELIVVDDGENPVDALLPADSRIRYVRLDRRRSIGAKRNIACEHSRGDFVAHWDDDDWMADGRLSAQLAPLRNRDDAVCGMSRLSFMDPLLRQAWQYRYDDRARPWVAGGTLCYPRGVWARHAFPDVREGEDTRFVWALRDTRVLTLDDPPLYVAMVHDRNTCPKRTEGPRWHPRTFAEVRRLLGADAPFYDAFPGTGLKTAGPTR